MSELRALIAEQSSELTADNLSSLKERLDHLEELVGASFVTVLNRDQLCIAQSHTAPWLTVDNANEYFATAPQPSALFRLIFANHSGGAEGDAAARYALWTYGGRLYHVVAIGVEGPTSPSSRNTPCSRSAKPAPLPVRPSRRVTATQPTTQKSSFGMSSKLTGSRPMLDRSQVDEFAGHYGYFDSSKAKRELGYTYLSARDTLRRTVAWLVDKGFVNDRRRQAMKLDPSLANAY